MSVKDKYQQYLNDCALKWTQATQASEAKRLQHINLELIDDPKSIYLSLTRHGLKPYTIKTTFMRLCGFYEWLLNKKLKLGVNVYKHFINTHSNLFKNVYVSKKLQLSPSEALEKIKSIRDEDIRCKALQLYVSGMRYSESFTLHKDGAGWYVKGKRGLIRRVFLTDNLASVTFTRDRVTFYRELKRVGLTAHMLRKYAATNAIRAGADIPELLTIFGWSSAQTAIRYLQSRKEESLDKLMAKGYNQAEVSHE